MKRFAAVLAVGAMVLAACGGTGGPTVLDARIGAPTGPNAALYFTVESDESDMLVGASTDVATAVDLHETQMDSDGTMGMVAIDQLVVPAGGELVLEPGGYHLMLIEVDQSLQTGDEVDVVLEFATAGKVDISAEVVDPADTVMHEGHDG